MNNVSNPYFLINNEWGEALAPFLESCGATLARVSPPELPDQNFRLPVPSFATLLAAFADPELPLCAAYAAAAENQTVTLLPILLSGSKATIGPYRRSSVTGCWACLASRLQPSTRSQVEDAAEKVAYWVRPAQLDLLAASALLLVKREERLPGCEAMVWVLDAANGSLTSRVAIPVDGCLLCGSVRRASAEQLQQELLSLLGDQ